MPDEHKLQGELKDIYERVMNTPVGTSNQTQNAPQENKQEKQIDPPPKAVSTPPQNTKTPPPIPQPPQNFVYSSKHGKKTIDKQETKKAEADTTHHPQKKEKVTEERKPHKALYVGAGTAVFTVIYAVIWALFFGLV